MKPRNLLPTCCQDSSDKHYMSRQKYKNGYIVAPQIPLCNCTHFASPTHPLSLHSYPPPAVTRDTFTLRAGSRSSAHSLAAPHTCIEKKKLVTCSLQHAPIMAPALRQTTHSTLAASCSRCSRQRVAAGYLTNLSYSPGDDLAVSCSAGLKPCSARTRMKGIHLLFLFSVASAIQTLGSSVPRQSAAAAAVARRNLLSRKDVKCSRTSLISRHESRDVIPQLHHLGDGFLNDQSRTVLRACSCWSFEHFTQKRSVPAQPDIVGAQSSLEQVCAC